MPHILAQNSAQTITQIFKKVLFEGSKKEFGTRHRSYFVRTYLPLDRLTEIFEYAKHYAVIEHSKEQDGMPHRHFIVEFNNGCYPTGFAKRLNDDTEQSYIRVCHDRYAAFDYMLHVDEKSVKAHKARYSEKDVLTDDYSFWQRSAYMEAKRQEQEDFLAVLLQDKLPPLRELATTYGRDFVINYRRYMEFRHAVLFEESLTCTNEEIDSIKYDAVLDALAEASTVCEAYGVPFTAKMIKAIAERRLVSAINSPEFDELVKKDIERGDLR